MAKSCNLYRPAFHIDRLSSHCTLQRKMVQEQKVRWQKQYRRGMYFVKGLLLSYVPLKRYSSWLQSRDRMLLLQDPKYLMYLTFCTWHWEQEGQLCSTASDTEKYPEKGETMWVTPGPDGAVDLRSHGYFNGPCAQRYCQKQYVHPSFGTYENMKPEFHFWKRQGCPWFGQCAEKRKTE